MTAIGDSSLTGLLGGTSSGAAAENTATQNMLNQQDFFSLMIAQFQNQDPFKPMESGEFLGQIAQFSTVDGIHSLNTAFGDLQTQLTSDQALQASALIDRDVLIPTSTVRYGGTGEVSGRVDVPLGADRVTVEVVDGSGQTVRSYSAAGAALDAQFEFSWDGRDAEGNAMPAADYTVRVRAGQGDAEVALVPELAGRVSAVRMGASGLLLEVAGFGDVPFSSISRIA
ncbi:flagellar hook assembly protein FlgD [Abyssibacter sp.]|uniref:flagellar hook assembly protein FlgD n=1 Tax=Abyssibacter sp. TaxID=2320200 RepID=UPI0025BFBD81|nr:flagellar hook assembly protein FlgD [Abyssibacter sp.]MCK5857706.1 flagellar hook assembly protein FlgD [Abyssibacter sp.]